MNRTEDNGDEILLGFAYVFIVLLIIASVVIGILGIIYAYKSYYSNKEFEKINNKNIDKMSNIYNSL